MAAEKKHVRKKVNQLNFRCEYGTNKKTNTNVNEYIANWRGVDFEEMWRIGGALQTAGKQTVARGVERD